MMRIFIPTLGRINNQITYNSLPVYWRPQVTFVVQEHESKAFMDKYDHPIMVVPDGIGIAKTRELIYEQNRHDEGGLFQGRKYAMFDDDIVFRKRNRLYKDHGGPSKSLMTDSDFDTMFDFVDEMLTYHPFGGLKSAGLPPSKNEWQFGTGVFCAMFFNGHVLPKLDWSLPYGEDIHMSLQLLGRGYQSFVSDLYLTTPKESNVGGCTLEGRTIDKINECHVRLTELYPGIVTLTGEHSPQGYSKIKTLYNKQHKKGVRGLAKQS